MQSEAPAPMTQCSNCGADVHAENDVCPACGAPLAEDRPSESAHREVLLDLIQRSNQELLSAGTKAAESAFGIGCWLGMLLTLLILAILIGLTRDWILGAIVGFGLLLVVTGVAINLSRRAKAINIAATFKRIVSRDIDASIKTNRFSQEEFSRTADQILDKDAPLRRYIPIRNDKETPSVEES